jgi:hypothetical protein
MLVLQFGVLKTNSLSVCEENLPGKIIKIGENAHIIFKNFTKNSENTEKKLSILVKKESQPSKMDEYHLVWMLIV